jgi:hypothetical protein
MDLDLGGNITECTAKVSANELEGGNRGDRDQRCDQRILDRGDPGMVFEQVNVTRAQPELLLLGGIARSLSPQC